MPRLLGSPLLDFAFGRRHDRPRQQGDGGTQTTLGSFGIPGMLAEVAAFPPPAALMPTALFVVWGGADDFEIGGSVTVAVADIDAIVAAAPSLRGNPYSGAGTA